MFLPTGLSLIFLCNVIRSLFMIETSLHTVSVQVHTAIQISISRSFGLSSFEQPLTVNRSMQYQLEIRLAWCSIIVDHNSSHTVRFARHFRLLRRFLNVVYYIFRSPNYDSLNQGPEHENILSPSTSHILPKCHTDQPFCRPRRRQPSRVCQLL